VEYEELRVKSVVVIMVLALETSHSLGTCNREERMLRTGKE
jgi:hypothetical protein